MSFFQKLGNALSRFMYGRNGSDQLGWASLVLLLVLNTVNLFVKYSSETVHTIHGGFPSDGVDPVSHVLQESAQAAQGECLVSRQGREPHQEWSGPQRRQGA